MVDDLFCKLLGVLTNLSEARTNLSLQMGVLVADEGSQERNGSLVHYFLGKVGSGLTNFAQSRSRDLLEVDFRLLDAENEQWNGSAVDNVCGQVFVMLGDVGEGPGSVFLHTRVELLQTGDEGVESTGLHDSTSKGCTVFGYSSKNESSGLFEESLS